MAFLCLLLAGCKSSVHGQASNLVGGGATVVGVTHTSAQFMWDTLTGTTGYVEFGISPSELTSISQQKWLSKRHILTQGGLRPGTRYYFRVVTGTGTKPDTVLRGPIQEFETLPAPADRFGPPTPPVPVDLPTAPPDVTGRTFTVSVDAQGLCVDLQAQITAAAKEPGELNHEVVIPAKARCVGTFQLPPRTGTGWIVIRSAALDQLPPDVRVSPRERGSMAILSGNLPGRNDRHDSATLSAPYGEPTRRWYMAGLEVTHEAGLSDVNPVTSVTPAAGGVRLVTRNPHGFKNDALVQFFHPGPVMARTAGRVTVIGPQEFLFKSANAASIPAVDSFVTQDPAFYPFLWASKDLTSEIVFDRCYFHGRDFPDRLFIGLQLHGRRLQLINSWLENVNSWRTINPDNPRDFLQANAFLISVGVDISGTIGARIVNNHLDVNGISLFAQEFGVPVWTQDIEIRNNRLTMDDKHRWHPSNKDSNGLYYPVRLLMEFKRGERIHIEGNIFENLWVDAYSIPSALLFSSRNGGGGPTDPNRIRDVNVVNNIFRHNGAGIIIYGGDDRNELDTLPVSRTRIFNNLIYDIDAVKHVTAQGEGAISYRRGWCFGTLFSTEDVSFEHNNCIDPRGFGPMMLWSGNGRGGGLRIQNNIFTLNSQSGLHGIFFESDEVTKPLPADRSASALASFRSYARSAPAYDTDSFFSYNVIIPGVRDAASPNCYDSRGGDCSFSMQACRQMFADLSYIYCVNGDSSAQRHASMDFAAPAKGDFTIGGASAIRDSQLCGGGTCTSDNSDPGVVMGPLWTATKMIQVPVVEWFGDNVRFQYRMSTESVCRLDLWDATSDNPVSSRLDEGNIGDREYWLPVRDGSRLAVSWRIACANDIASGVVKEPSASARNNTPQKARRRRNK